MSVHARIEIHWSGSESDPPSVSTRSVHRGYTHNGAANLLGSVYIEDIEITGHADVIADALERAAEAIRREIELFLEEEAEATEAAPTFTDEEVKAVLHVACDTTEDKALLPCEADPW